MKRISIVGLCVVSVFAFSLVGIVSAASATEIDPAPERGVCKAAAGQGVFSDSTCEDEEAKAGKGKEFVWVPSKEAAFTSTTGADTLKSFTPEGVELPAVECKKSKGKGKRNATTSHSVVTFEECSSAGEKCTGGAKAKVGQIVTFELEGTLGIVKDGVTDEDIVGEDLAGTGPGGLSSEFKCGANEIKTKGSVIGIATPGETKASTTSKLTFAATGKAQEPESFEGGPKDTLQAEINGLGGGTFPFASVEITEAKVKGESAELREGPGPAAPPSPHWYKEGVVLPEANEAGGLKVKTGTGNGTFTILDSTAAKESKCKMEDTGKIWNPAGGGPGEGTIESAKFTNCQSQFCAPAEKPELKALNLPWKLIMQPGNPPLVEVKKMELGLICTIGGVQKQSNYKPIPGMPIKLSIANGIGKGEHACTEPNHTTQLRFKLTIDVLEEPIRPSTGGLEGDDCIWGEAAEEKITVNSP